MDRRGLILGLAAAGLAPARANAADKPPVKFAKIFPFLDKYLALPANQRDRFRLAYTFRMNGQAAGALKAEIIQADGRRAPFLIGPDGRPGRLPTAAELQGAFLALEAPADAKMGVKLDLEPSLAPAREMNAHDLAAAIVQANAGMAQAAGLMSFAVPKLTAVGLPGSGSGEAILADGKRASLPVGEGAPYYAPAKLPGAQKLVFARPPTTLAFLDKV
jgi:hypothetical protein